LDTVSDFISSPFIDLRGKSSKAGLDTVFPGIGVRLSAGDGASPVSTDRDYLVITPQAMRSPALPAGSVFWSSALAWMTRAVPPLLNSEWLSLPSVDVFIFNLEMGFAVFANREVGIVAGVVAFRILQDHVSFHRD
jgi:hypothetical protein